MTPRLRCSTSCCCNSNALPYSMRPNSRISHLYIDSQAVDRVESLSQRLIKGRLRVNGRHHRLSRTFRFHCRHSSRDHLARLPPTAQYTHNPPTPLPPLTIP